MNVKYYWNPETGDYAEAIKPEENVCQTRNKYQVMKNGYPMELTEKEYESYIEEQLRNAAEKNKSYHQTREYFLDEAKTIVCQNREEEYGSPEDNFETIACLWRAYIKNKDVLKPIDMVDVAIMMCLMKIARIESGDFKEDSWIDAIGYLACGAELDSAKRGEK